MVIQYMQGIIISFTVYVDSNSELCMDDLNVYFSEN